MLSTEGTKALLRMCIEASEALLDEFRLWKEEARGKNYNNNQDHLIM